MARTMDDDDLDMPDSAFCRDCGQPWKDHELTLDRNYICPDDMEWWR